MSMSKNEVLLVILTLIFLWEFVFYARYIIKRDDLEEEQVASVLSDMNVSSSDLWVLQRAQITLESITKLRENSCKIPILNPFAPKMLKFFQPFNQTCGANNKAFYFKSHVQEIDSSNASSTTPSQTQSMILEERKKPRDLRCCYKQLGFEKTYGYKPVVDLDNTENRCKVFRQNRTIVPADSEYLIIKCWNITAIIQTKNETRGKISNSQLFKYEPIHYELLFYVPKPSREVLYKTGKNLVKYHQGDNKEALNVIIIGLDKVSRANFIRLMGKTFRFLRTELDAIDLQGFNKMGDATLNNSLALLTGHDFGSVISHKWFSGKEMFFDDCPWIWKNFSEKGYITALADDYVSVLNYRFHGFKKQPTDYYNAPIMQWYHEKERWKRFGTQECIGNRLVLNLIPDHAKQIADVLKTRPYFQFMWISKVHEQPGYAALADDSILETLKHFHSSGTLDRSLVILMSDHGWRAGSIMMNAQTRLENRLSFAFLILPQWFREKYSTAYANLQENQYRLTSPYDIHSTLLDILNVPGQLGNQVIGKRDITGSKGVSLFLPISRARSCSEAGIDEEWCACTDYQPFANSSVTTELANYAVNTINSWLRPFPSCRRYVLDIVLSAEVKRSENYLGAFHLREKQQFRISLSLSTTNNTTKFPLKKALFEVTIFSDKNYWYNRDPNRISMSTEVFRLNYYDSADCMPLYSLKKICTC